MKAKQHLENLFRVDPDEKSRKDCLRLDMNEGVPGLPEGFVKDILSGVGPEFLATYPEYKKLREKIASYNRLKPENISLANGSDAAVKYVFDAYISRGDKVLITDPTFAMYPVYCDMFGAKQVVVEYNDDLSFPEEDFMDKLSSGVKMAVIVNPNNPTGSVLKKETLLQVIEKARNLKTLIVVDEAYFYFYPESVIEEVKNFENLIVLRTFSKLCAMAAIRSGYAASSVEIADNLRKVKPTYDVNGLAVLFAESLLEDPKIIARLVDATNEGKEYLISKLAEEGLEYRSGLANFILIKCKGKTEDVKKKLAEKGILVASGFKQDFLKDYIRVTIGDRLVMEKFWEVFSNIGMARNV